MNIGDLVIHKSNSSVKFVVADISFTAGVSYRLCRHVSKRGKVYTHNFETIELQKVSQ